MSFFKSYPTEKDLANFNALFGLNQTDYRFEGSKYKITQGLYGSSLLKVIRAELKAYLAKLKKEQGINIKLSCRKNQGGYTTSYTFEVTDSSINVLSSEFSQIKKEMENIIRAYNYDDSDSMTDYFNVRFYGGYVKVAYDLELRDSNEKQN
jgi:hypothetical protein